MDFAYFHASLFLGKSLKSQMHRSVLALSYFLIMIAAPIFEQDFNKGLEAYQNKDYATALKK